MQFTLPGWRTSLAISLLTVCPAIYAEPAEPAATEGTVVVDWSKQLAGAPPLQNLSEQAMITSFESRGKVKLLVVDANTDPPSPLPEGRPALMVTMVEGEGAVGGVVVKPFSNPPLQGWMEFEAVLDESRHLAITARNESESMDPKDLSGRALFGSTMRPGMTTALRVDPGVQLGRSADDSQYLIIPVTIPPGVPTRYAVIWDFKSDPATIGFRVHGDWGGDPYDKAFVFEVNPEVATTGLDTFRILGNGFIGNVTVSSED